MWPFKRKPMIINHHHEAPKIVMTQFRDRIIMADNEKRVLREITFDEYTGQYKIQTIANF